MILALLLPLLAQAAWLPFEAFRFQPIDEAGRDEDFSRFRRDLERALETRNTRELLRFLDEEIVFSRSGARRGLQAFRGEWKLDGAKPEESPLWDRLRDTVRLGGAFEKSAFLAPYVSARWPERYPRFDFLAVLRKKVKLRKEPKAESSVLAELSQELVGRFDGLPNPEGWLAVRSASGLTGFVERHEARSPLDDQARFEKRKGRWMLREFITGDWEAHERPE